MLARSADLVIRIGRANDGPFRVMAVEESLGAAVFRHEDGWRERGTKAPAFAATVQARGHGQALAQLLR